MRNFLFLALFMSTSILAPAQHEFLSSFTANASDEGVFLEWTIIAGSTCLGVIIERSIDGIAYTEIEHIEEVCGNVVKPVSYTYLDGEPIVGQVSYYRLILGLDGTTDPVSITYYQVDDSGFSVRIDTALDELQVYSLQPHSEPYTVLLFDIQGRMIHTGSMPLDLYAVDISDIDDVVIFVQVIRAGKPLLAKKLFLSN